MRYPRMTWREAKLAFAALAGWLVSHGTALAQGALRDGMQPAAPAAGAGSSGGSFVLSYTIAVVCIGVAVLFVCRSARRRDRARPEEYALMFNDDGEVTH
jgi:hypothetical protein